MRGGASAIYTMCSRMKFSPMHFLSRVRHHQGYLVFVHVDILVLDVHRNDDYEWLLQSNDYLVSIG